MHRGNNFFYKAVKEDENHTTELFCNLLKYDYIRYVFLSFFNLNDKAKIPIETLKYEDIDTQNRIEDNNILPDITIKKNDYKCFFEIKTNKETKLQNSQKEEYPEELKNSGEEVKTDLIFLVPKGYKHIEEIKIVKKEYKLGEMFYWEDFIKYIENTDLPKGNILVSEFISFLKNVIKKQDLSITLNLEEMALLQHPKDLMVAINLHKKIKNIIDKSGEKIRQETDLEAAEENDDDEYTFTFKKGDKEVMFFGLWYGMVEGNEQLYDYLFCYGVPDTKSDEKYIENFKKLIVQEEVQEVDGYLIRKFDIYDFAKDNEEELINNISKKLIGIIKQLS